MDFSTVLKPDVYRTVAVIILPGLTASFPWIYWFFWPEMSGAATWKEMWPAYLSLIAVVSLLAGLVIEDLATRIEVENIDRYVIKQKEISEADFYALWEDYLGSGCNDQLVAHRYLRSMLTRFKFELSIIVAIGSATVAVVCSFLKGNGFDLALSASIVITSCIVIHYLYEEAKKGGDVLYDVRSIIVKKQAHNSIAARNASNADCRDRHRRH